MVWILIGFWYLVAAVLLLIVAAPVYLFVGCLLLGLSPIASYLIFMALITLYFLALAR